MEDNNTGKPYPQEVKLFARGLYIQGGSYSEVARRVKEQFPRARCNAETIRRWAQDPDWERARTEVNQYSLERQKGTAIETLRRHEEVYERLIDIGVDALEGEVTGDGQEGRPGLRPRSASEASGMIDTGIRGQRTAMKELVTLDFLQAVFMIVAEEVDDSDARTRIAVRFRELAEKF